MLGGNRSGKSAFAEHLLADEPTVDYIATSARSGDRDWEDRVRRHQQRRPSTWRTIETADVARELRVDSTPALIDSVTAWLTRTMDDCRYWADELAETSARDLDDRLDEFDQAWEATTRRVAAVSDEVGSGVIAPTVAGRRFADRLGVLNQRLAATADEVYLVTAGIAQRLK